MTPAQWAKRIGEKANQIKWCVHIVGPDDVCAMPSYEAAVEMAERCNRDIVAHNFEKLRDIICFAVAEPYLGHDHAAALDNDLARQWIAEQGTKEPEEQPRTVDRDALIDLLEKLHGLSVYDCVETAEHDGSQAGPSAFDFSLSADRPDIWIPLDRILFRLKSGDAVQ